MYVGWECRVLDGETELFTAGERGLESHGL